MADVLLVHVREDEALADSIGISLERSGLTVARGESVFDVGDEVPCVVVLWSDISTRSSMVRDVAIRAQREGKLVAAMLGVCETPLGFSRPAPHDLSEWGGDPDDPILDAVFFAADRLVCAAKLGQTQQRSRPSQPYAQRPMTQQRATPREISRDLPEAPLPVQQVYERAPRAPAPQPAEDSSVGAMPANLAAETLAWKQIENSKDPQDFLDYLGHYGPKGIFSELASMKLDKLTAKPKANAKGGFMQHNPAPHAEKRAQPAPPPRRAEPPVQRVAEQPRRPEPVRAPAPRTEAMPPRMEMRAEARSDERLSELSRIADQGPRGTSNAPGRTRSATAARRRAGVAPAQARIAIHEENRGGFPWAILVVVAVLGAGGLALYQNLPKSNGQNGQQAGMEEALRAAPMDDLMTADDENAAPDGTSLADANTAVKRSDFSSKKQPGAAAPMKVARADTAGVGGPIVSMTPRRDTGGGDVPQPVVTFRPLGTSAPQPSSPAPQPAAPASDAGAFDPTTPAATRYVQPQWIKQPGAQALGTYYPQQALDSNTPGKASLDCAILLSGKLNCVVVSETPAKMGFGEAAVKASRSYLASPQALDGTMAYGARTKLTISFK